MLKIRTFILALSLTPLLALNWQTPSPAQTSPSGGSAGSLSGGNAGSLSGGNAGGQSGAGNETANNADNGGNNNEGNDQNPSGSGETLIPIPSSIRIIRTAAGSTIRISIRSVQRELNAAALNLLNSNNSGVLVALFQGGSIGQTASDNLTNFLSHAGVNTDLGNNLRVILSRIVPNQENADVDINQLNNAINTYNQIIQQSSPVTLQALSQSQDFVAIGKALKELRAAVN
ncbi:hypothetical protein [Anabaena sp. AL09]|uniref:hypothetical protein n=1 Tax=Anabaena sp. AL09 TaxID=1710891 RepID=UPI000AF1A13D|nr:hypothetical protein [Anabaena sp. AL09]